MGLPASGAPGGLSKEAIVAHLSPLPPFAFERKRLRIDWRILHGVDIERVVRRGKGGNPQGQRGVVSAPFF